MINRKIESRISSLNQYMEENDIYEFPYDDLRAVKLIFEDEFKKIGKHESINADLNNYLMFIAGLSAKGILRFLENPVELYRIESLLKKTFFEWHPIYNFLEPFDLKEFNILNYTLFIYEFARKELIDIIDEYRKDKHL